MNVLAAATVEERITALVEYAIERFYLEKDKKQIVIELAQDLEGLIATDKICMEITNRLQDYLSPRTIRGYLDEKYKNQSRVKNAKKQRVIQAKSLSEVTTPPPDQSDGSSGNRQNTDEQSVKKNIMDNDLRSLFPKESSSNSSSSPPPQQDKLRQHEDKNSKETIRGLREEVSHYQEIIGEFNHFTTADSIIESESHVSVKEIVEYIQSNGIKTIDEKISIGVQFDKDTGRILSFSLVPRGTK